MLVEDSGSSIVLDTGSYSCKIGLSREEQPSLSVRTIAAYKHGSLTPECFGKDSYDKPQDQYDIRPLIAGDNQIDWNKTELFWKSLAIVDPRLDFSRKNVLTASPLWASKSMREKTAQVMFECMEVPAFFSISAPLLILYSSGRHNGIIFESGHNCTGAVPIIDGSVLSSSIVQSPLAGSTISNFLKKSMPDIGIKESFDIKENEIRVSADYTKELGELCTLPDGEKLDLPIGSVDLAVKLLAANDQRLP